MVAMTRRLPLLVASFAMIAAACTSGGETEPAPTDAPPSASALAAQVASSDLAADSPEAVEIGVFSSTDEAGVRFLSFGEIDVAFSFLGTAGEGPPADGPATAARFVPAPGADRRSGAGPTLTDPADVAGVYVTPEVTFPEAGIWNVTVTASVDGAEPEAAEAAFTVFPEHHIPAPGDEALATMNLTVDSMGVPAAAIDSRAQDGNAVPDPELHRTTVAEALRQGRPALVQFATPVYCTSNFCGPTVQAQEALAREYGDVAEFIHVEIWRSFDDNTVNQAAADWLLREGDLTEPWMFLIDGDGVIVDRWGPLFDLDDVRASLEALRD
jgi:hypothetical protein